MAQAPNLGGSDMKKRIQSFLRWLGLLERLQSSFIYDLYWRIFDRRLLEERSKELAFYRDLLTGFRQGQLVFDVGANCGGKADVFLRLGAKVLAVEPDLANQEILRRKFHHFRISKKPVEIVGKALSDRNATETMWVAAPGSALNTLSQKWVNSLAVDAERFGETIDFRQKREVHTTTLDDLMKSHGMPYYVKIDVEGYEANVLRGLKRPVPFLSFEVNLPDFRAEGLECISMLGKISPEGRFNYAVTCKSGLALSEWLTAEQFAEAFKKISEGSVEVVWKTPGQR